MSMSPNQLKQIWCTGKKTKPTDYVQTGDRVWLYYEHFTDDGDVVTKVHDAVVTKVFAKSFQAMCEGELVKGVPLELERSPKCPRGVWQFSPGPIVNETEFEVFKLLHTGRRSPGPVWAEPESLDDTTMCDHNPGLFS